MPSNGLRLRHKEERVPPVAQEWLHQVVRLFAEGMEAEAAWCQAESLRKHYPTRSLTMENMVKKQSFATLLRDAREAAALSQFELAHQTGIPQRQISDIETGTRQPTWNDAVKLIEACGAR